MTGDTGPMTWGYVFSAVCTGFLLVGPLLLLAYLDSDFHRRGVNRRRAQRFRRQKGTAS